MACATAVGMWVGVVLATTAAPAAAPPVRAAPGSASAAVTAPSTSTAAPDVGQATGTVEAVDPSLVEAERRQRIQALLGVAGLVGLAAGYLAWRRLRALTPRVVAVEIDGLPASAAPGTALGPRVQVKARAPLEHDGVTLRLLRRRHPGPRAKKRRFAEREVERCTIAPPGTVAAGEAWSGGGSLALPADAEESFDHAFGVDLPPGREAIVHWVVQAALRLGDAEVQAEQIVAVRRVIT